jgi:hypothetical protein
MLTTTRGVHGCRPGWPHPGDACGGRTCAPPETAGDDRLMTWGEPSWTATSPGSAGNTAQVLVVEP